MPFRDFEEGENTIAADSAYYAKQGMYAQDGSVLGASMRQENIVGSAYAKFQDYPGPNNEEEDKALASGDFIYQDHVPEKFRDYDYEYARYATSPRHAQWITSRLERMEKDREIMENGGIGGFLASTFAAMTSPEQAPLYFIPGGVVLKNSVMSGSRAAEAGIRSRVVQALTPKTGTQLAATEAAIGAVSTAAQEGLLHLDQPMRTAEESSYAIAGSAIFSGLIAAGVYGTLSGAKKIHEKIDKDAMEMIDSAEIRDLDRSIGAAQTKEELTAAIDARRVELETERDAFIANGQEIPVELQRQLDVIRTAEDTGDMVGQLTETKYPKLYRYLGWFNPNIRLATATLSSARMEGSNFVSDSLSRGFNKLGIRRTEALSDGIKMFEISFGRKTDDIYKEMYKEYVAEIRKLKSEGQQVKQLKSEQFAHEVGMALSDSDTHTNKIIEKTAKRIRNEIMNEIESRLDMVNLMPRNLVDGEIKKIDETMLQSFIDNGFIDKEDIANLFRQDGTAKANIISQLNKISARNPGVDIVDDLMRNGKLKTEIAIPKGDKSYFHRIFNFDALTSDAGTEFIARITDWLEGESKLARQQELYGDIEDELATVRNSIVKAKAKLDAMRLKNKKRVKEQEESPEAAQERRDAEQSIQDTKNEMIETLMRITDEDESNIRALVNGILRAERTGDDETIDRLLKELNLTRTTKNDAIAAVDFIRAELKKRRRNSTQIYNDLVYRETQLLNELKKQKDLYKRIEPQLRADAKRGAEDIYNTITKAKYEPSISIDHKVHQVGPLKVRTLDIPTSVLQGDEAAGLKSFLVKDVNEVMSHYIKSIAPQLAVFERYKKLEPGEFPTGKASQTEGSQVLNERIGAVIDDYNAEISRLRDAKDRKKAVKLEKEREQVREDLEAMRDVLFNQYKNPQNPDSVWVQSARKLRHFNVMRMLGMVTISSIPDIGSTVARRGLMQFSKHIVKWATNFKQMKLTAKYLNALAMAADINGAGRFEMMHSTDEFQPRSHLPKDATKLEKAKALGGKAWENSRVGFSKVTLMQQWNNFWKQFNAIAYMDEVFEHAIKASKGKLSSRELEQYARAGIGIDDLKAIAKELTSDQKQNGLWMPDFDKWTDQEVARKIRFAVKKEVDTTIVTPDKGDLPLAVRGEIGKTVAQFKSFPLAANEKIVMSTIDDFTADKMAGIIIGITLGYISYAAKQMLKGEDFETDFDTFIREGLDRSGYLAIWGDLNAMVSKLSSGNIDVARLFGADKRVLSRYASRNMLGTIAGVSAGGLEDTAKIARAITNGDYSESDVRAIRRMLPMNNVWALHYGFTQLEKSTYEALQ